MIETKLSYNPNFAVHPGESLKNEMEFLHLSQVELSQRTGLSEKCISQIVNGVAPITSDTAIKLELALGTPAVFWNNLQKNYDLNMARIALEKRITDEIAESKKITCYSELVKLGFAENTSDWNEKTKNLLRFFGVTSLSSIVNVTELAAFRGASGVLDQYSLAAWLRCGELQAREIEVGKFDKKEIKKIIPEIKKLILNSDNLGRELQRICAARGIAVVYTPYFKNIKINGSSRFINGKAIIQLNAKGGYSDIFWFTFFHELGHILLHGSKDKFLEYEGDVKDKKEGEADRFAREILIPSSSLKEFLEDKPLNAEKIKNFANLMMVDSGIVLGRLAHEKIVSWKNISHLRKRIVINLNVKN